MRELKRRKLEKLFASIDQDESQQYDGTGCSPDELKEILEAKELDVSVGLVELKDFLNQELPRGLVTTGRGLTSQEEESLRQEIIQDIAPIVSPSADTDVLDALTRLVEKINSMGLRPPWAVTEKPEKTQWIEREGPLEGLEFGYIGPPGPVMRVGGKKFIVYHQIYADHPGSKKDFYSVIIKTLEDGSFQKLKRCTECSRFFVADRLSEKFCRPECSKAYFDRGAVDRVRKSRAKPKDKKKRLAGKKHIKKRRRPQKQ